MICMAHFVKLVPSTEKIISATLILLRHLSVGLRRSATRFFAVAVIMTFRYSSRAAQKADWAAGHKFECKAWKQQVAAGELEAGHVPEIAVRMLCRTLWMMEMDQKRRESGEKVPFWRSFEAVSALLDHTEAGSGLSAQKREWNETIAAKAMYASSILFLVIVINLCTSIAVSRRK
jgi:hypothetical protein